MHPLFSLRRSMCSAVAAAGLFASLACAQVASTTKSVELPGGFPLTPEGFPRPLDGLIEGGRKPSVKELITNPGRQAPGIQASNIQGPELTEPWRSALDKLLAAGNYDEIELQSTGAMSRSSQFTEWIQQKAEGGHVRLMWTLAERHSMSSKREAATQWAYTALLATLQERAICLDDNVNFAATQLSEAHPAALYAVRQNPLLISAAKKFAFERLIKIDPKLVDPTRWLCFAYSDPIRRNHAQFLPAYDALYFPYLRARARNKLRTQWVMQLPPEILPALPLSALPPPSCCQ